MAKYQPIYFTSLELENVRCFGERQILDLTDDEGRLTQWTLLLGDNGVGKTTLLQCLAWMRPVPALNSPENSPGPPDTIAPALDSEENEVWKSLLRAETRVELELDLKATLSVGRTLGRRQKRGVQEEEIETGLRMSGKDGVLQERLPTKNSLPPNRQDMTLHDLPIFAYSAARHMGISNLDNDELSDPLASLLSGSAELYDAEEVLLDLDYLAAKSGKSSNERRLQQIKKTLATLLPDIQSEADIKILGPKVLGRPEEPSGVQFKTPYGWVPLSGLSLGYQTTLAWTVDLASKLYARYPNSRKPLAEPAIVLVDGIDLHLHPRWQRQIIGDIAYHFPKTQFIATSHSPSIVQALTNANLVVLQQRDGQVVVENRPSFVKAWRVDQILTSDLFGVPVRSKQIEKWVAERNDLLGKKKRDKSEETRLKVLDQELDGLPTAEDHEDQAAMDLIRQMATKLREQLSES